MVLDAFRCLKEAGARRDIRPRCHLTLPRPISLPNPDPNRFPTACEGANNGLAKLHIRRNHRTQRGDLLFKTRSTRLRHCLGRGEIPPPYIGLGGGKLSNLFLQCFFSYYCLVRSISQLWWWKSLAVSRCSKYTSPGRLSERSHICSTCRVSLFSLAVLGKQFMGLYDFVFRGRPAVVSHPHATQPHNIAFTRQRPADCPALALSLETSIYLETRQPTALHGSNSRSAAEAGPSVYRTARPFDVLRHESNTRCLSPRVVPQPYLHPMKVG